MNVWIMRHGEAGPYTPTDIERTLTEKGRQDAFNQGKWLGQSLLERGLCFDKIIVSPYVRTQQTWARVFEGMQAVDKGQKFANLSSLIELWEGITPDGDPQNAMNYLHFLREEGAKNLLIVSHMPLVYRLAQGLSAGQAHVHFETAVIAELNCQQDPGQLVLDKHP
ncbi:phosphohistidine phosphatase SixA [Pasteurellaceae bacterium RH1A]|nr:phosphohistidine phosphatase SixA [Pasteurellaceae bacterium RH1A]